MSDLPYPFSATDEAPFYTVALGNGEFIRVVLAGDYIAANKKLQHKVLAYRAAMYLAGGHSEECFGGFGDEPCVCGYDTAIREFDEVEDD
jgi:hypothetical protein